MPIAPHIYFTKFLDDNKLEERQLGLEFSKDLLLFCDEMWVFGTYVSSGMMNEISLALEQNMKVKFVDANLELNKINNRIRGKNNMNKDNTENQEKKKVTLLSTKISQARAIEYIINYRLKRNDLPTGKSGYWNFSQPAVRVRLRVHRY